MSEFLKTLADPATPFLRYALLLGILSSVAFGITGSYVVARRLTAMAGGIAHCVLAGIGLALFLQARYGWDWCQPRLGAVAAALPAAVLVGIISLRAREREDTAISALWACGMAAGLLFLSKTPGYVDPMSYLFGNILMITSRDLWLVAALDAVIIVLGLGFYRQFLALSFDEEFAALRGVRVQALFLLLLILTALTVVLMVSVVGIILVIALLTLPAAAASRLTGRLWKMMLLSGMFCMFFITGGMVMSFIWDLPTGPVIILLAGSVYLTASLGSPLKRG